MSICKAITSKTADAEKTTTPFEIAGVQVAFGIERMNPLLWERIHDDDRAVKFFGSEKGRRPGACRGIAQCLYDVAAGDYEWFVEDGETTTSAIERVYKLGCEAPGAYATLRRQWSYAVSEIETLYGPDATTSKDEDENPTDGGDGAGTSPSKPAASTPTPPSKK